MRRTLTALAVALVLPLTACGDDDDPTGINVEASGTYRLSTINGEELPFTLAQSGEDTFEVLDGTIELRVDKTFTDSTTFRLTQGGTATPEVDVLTGTYSQTGDALRFTLPGGATYTMAVTDGTLTDTGGELVLVYRR